jgi:hypothetical protein
MRSKILTFALTGLIGLGLGAGIGVAAAQTRAGTVTVAPDQVAPGHDVQMDEMHAVMRDQMPANLSEQCDGMHTAMATTMGERHTDSQMGRFGSESDEHRQHHR